jgi:hypothetical protein
MFYQELCIYHGSNHQTHEEDKTIYVNPRMLSNLGVDKTKVYKSTSYITYDFMSIQMHHC